MQQPPDRISMLIDTNNPELRSQFQVPSNHDLLVDAMWEAPMDTWADAVIDGVRYHITKVAMTQLKEEETTA